MSMMNIVIPTIENLTRELGDGISVLDGGAGKGSFAYGKFPNCRIVALDVKKVEGVDDPPNVERKTGDLEKLPFTDGEFNLVALNFVLEHTLNPEAVLSEIRRVLKPDGIFYFSVPDYRSFDDRLFRFALKFRHPVSFFKATPDSHNQKFTPDNVRRLIGKFGFQIRTMAKYPGGFTWIPVSLRFPFLRFFKVLGINPTRNGNFIVRAERNPVEEQLVDVPYVCFHCGTPAISAVVENEKWQCSRCDSINIHFSPGR
jgi:SAM-dependent methyltransferase